MKGERESSCVNNLTWGNSSHASPANNLSLWGNVRLHFEWFVHPAVSLVCPFFKLQWLVWRGWYEVDSNDTISQIHKTAMHCGTKVDPVNSLLLVPEMHGYIYDQWICVWLCNFVLCNLVNCGFWVKVPCVWCFVRHRCGAIFSELYTVYSHRWFVQNTTSNHHVSHSAFDLCSFPTFDKTYFFYNPINPFWLIDLTCHSWSLEFPVRIHVRISNV